MKSVTNSNRVPFQVKRNGHDDGLRSSSVTVERAGLRRGAGADAGFRLQDAGRPEHADDVGRRARAEAERRRRPAPTAGVAADVSSCWRRLPARISTFAPIAAAVADARGEPHAQRRVAAAAVVAPDAQTPPAQPDDDVGVAVAVEIAERERAPAAVAAAAQAAGSARAVTSVHSRCPRLRNSRGPSGVSRQQVEQAVVVVVDELRAPSRRAVAAGAVDDAKPPAAVARARAAPAPSDAAEEEVGEAVLVDVAGRQRACSRPRAGSPASRGDVAERAVAQVAEERGRAVAPATSSRSMSRRLS